MLDVNPQDLIDLILNAALKMRYREFGFSPSEANHIYEVNIHPEVNESFSTLLLPYCAKLP